MMFCSYPFTTRRNVSGSALTKHGEILKRVQHDPLLQDSL